MKKVLAFDVDQTLNIAKTPIPPEIAELLTKCLDHYEICRDGLPLATVTNTKTIPAVTPAQGETKKFYKVVVEFAASPSAD